MAVVAELEGTLTQGCSARALARYLLRRGRAFAYGRFVLRHLPTALQAHFGSTRQAAFQARWQHEFARLLAGMDHREVVSLADWAVETELWPKRRPDVLAALKVHQAAGEELFITSEVYQPVLERFAARLGARALGTPLEWQGGRLTGRLAAAVNTGEVKAARLHEALGEVRLYAAYSDTEADIPMLMLSDRPVAVYPDSGLRSTARALAWTVFERP